MKPVTLDGWLIVTLAGIPAAIAWICGDEAAKFISAVVIFYAKGLLSIIGVSLGALKGYRSMQFAQYKQNGGADPSNTPSVVVKPSTAVNGGTATWEKSTGKESSAAETAASSPSASAGQGNKTN